jgi:hypothetical protein
MDASMGRDIGCAVAMAAGMLFVLGVTLGVLLAWLVAA